MKNTKIYGGIYKKGPNKITDSFIMDAQMTILENKLAEYYLWETIAHNLMLIKQMIIPENIGKKILKCLLELKNKKIIIDPKIGDVHENVESYLFKKLGKIAGWVHTARSRNDQTITDQKLFTKKYLLDFFAELVKLEKVLLKKSQLYNNVVMPGYTHLRIAMPSTFGFWWQSYLDQIINLHQILMYVYETYDQCPLGAGASYGVNWQIDPQFTAQKLGFSQPLTNALSAINNRGIEDATIIANLAILATIFSRMMEDLIIWSLPEINYISISEEFTTGSSIMPQKINPDVAEKIRGKSAQLIANFNHVLIALKGTSSGYNRDSAESKIAIINSLEEILITITIAEKMLDQVIPNQKSMQKAVASSLPTKLADELVKIYKIPFRSAHKIVGTVLSEKTNKEKIKVDKKIINNAFDINHALDQYQYPGSPNPNFVSQINKKLETKIKKFNNWQLKQKMIFEQAEINLYVEVNNFVKN